MYVGEERGKRASPEYSFSRYTQFSQLLDLALELKMK
jgi:hypothetical protein